MRLPDRIKQQHIWEIFKVAVIEVAVLEAAGNLHLTKTGAGAATGTAKDQQCTLQFAVNAAKAVKFLLNQLARSRFIAGTVLH